MTAMHRLLTAGILSVAAALAGEAAADTPLESLDSWGKSRGWEGVGLLDLEGTGRCTGSLIRPDLVLTAAHCLYNEKGGLRDPRHIAFHAGWRDGASVAHRLGRAAIVHPAYRHDSDRNSERLRYDVALIQLEAPIVSTHADPFLPGGHLEEGGTVSVVSYGAGRFDAPSRQKSCTVLDLWQGMVALSCDVEPGSSGSPIFTMENGRPRIAAVVSAMGDTDGHKVSFAMDLAQPLSDLLKDFNAGRGVFPNQPAEARRMTLTGERGGTGAKFVRP